MAGTIRATGSACACCSRHEGRAVTHLHDAVEQALMNLLSARAEDGSICPSEVARALEQAEEGWRALMTPVRIVAGRLANDGVIEVTQRGESIDIGCAVGPVRLRRGAHFAD